MENKFSNRELEILNILGFYDDSKQNIVSFIEEKIKNNKIEKFHNKGIPLLYLKKILKKIDKDNSLLKKSVKLEYNIELEVQEMLNLTKSRI